MKFNLKDGISQEWNFKFRVRLGPFILLLSGLIFLGSLGGYSYFVKENFTPTQRLSSKLQAEYQVTRKFQNNQTTYAWGTFWHHCGAWLTADHVDFAFQRVRPEFVEGAQWRPNGLIDATLWSDNWDCDYRAPVAGEAVKVLGFPQRSETAIFAKGRVLQNRGSSASSGYELATWIIVLETGVEPVSTGMSGGMILDSENEPLGILVTTGGDFNGDWTADFAALTDLKEAYDISR